MKWINIKEELPADYHGVLVFAKSQGTGEPSPVTLAHGKNEKWELLKEGENNAYAGGDLMWNLEPEDITHWIALPPLPE